MEGRGDCPARPLNVRFLTVFSMSITVPPVKDFSGVLDFIIQSMSFAVKEIMGLMHNKITLVYLCKKRTDKIREKTCFISLMCYHANTNRKHQIFWRTIK